MTELKAFWGFLCKLWVAILGRWEPPGWLQAIGRGFGRLGDWAGRHKGWATIAVLLVGGLGTGAYLTYQYYENLPKPVTIEVSVTAPGLTPIKKDAKPEPAVVSFEMPVAPLSKIKKIVKKGVKLVPSHPGRWRWVTEGKLAFTPKKDWPVGAKFKVQLAEEGLVTKNTLLSTYELSFDTPLFLPKLGEKQFYKDPVQADQKKIVATFTFSHPVDGATFEKFLKLRYKPSNRELPERDLSFKVTYGKLKGQAHVHSEQIAVPRKDAFVEITLLPGVRAASGGPASKEKLTGKVRVPGLYNFFRITNIEPRVMDNERMEPEQILGVHTSVGVTEKEIKKSIKAWLLPRFHPTQKDRKRPYRWDNPERVSEAIAKKARRVRLRQLPAAKEYDTFHSFRYRAPANRYVYLQVKKGARAHGGYVLGETYQQIVRVPEFPKQVKLVHSGALLALSGERKVTVFARDVAGLRFEIARFLPDQLHHFVSQSEGNFSSPRFYHQIEPQHLADYSTQTRAISAAPGKPVYEAVDLGPYLNSNQGHRGLFLVRVDGWDPKRQQRVDPWDQRLILVTDLGVFIKRAADGTRMVFVQSIRTGAPVSGATVKVLGRNGLAVTTVRTGATGAAKLPNLEKLQREQTPTLTLVQKGKDWSFLPWKRRDRQLDVSRFDVGGVEESAGGDALNAFLFSDRGIYRPGEKFNVGFIVRRQDWAATYAGLPLIATITDPRGLEVKRLPIKLHASGFGELSYPTRETSPTGQYTVSISTARDGVPHSHLGSTKVTVREFLPDKMKIKVELSGKTRAWLHPKDLRANVTLSNLYGTPATDRRVRAKLTLTPGLPTLRRFPDHVFFDPLKPKGSIEETLDEQQTDNDGKAEFDLELERFHRATYRLALLAEGFEAEGGRSVTAEARAVVSPLSYLIGYKPDGELRTIHRGTARKVNLIAVGANGKLRSVKGLTATLIQRKVVSVLTRQNNGTYKYQSMTKEKPLRTKPLRIGAKGTNYRLPTGRAGDFALAVRDSKGQTLQRFDFTVAAAANVAREMEKSAQLKLALENKSVDPGGTLQVQIKAPYAGAGLITIERDRVYAHKWFKTDTTATVQTIQVPKNLEIGGYVSVAFVRSASSDEVFISPLSHGVIPFYINRDRRKVTLEIKGPERIKPGQALKVHLRADKPARAVLIAVDEGILRVARHKTPDPLTYFLQKRALGVRTLQLLDLILPEHKQLLGALAPGGGEETDLISANLNPFKRRRDKPAVFWSGLVDVGPKGHEVSYTVPDSFNGTLRLMAIAASDAAVGSAAESALVRGDFVITPMAPTVVAPDDAFEVPVTVANNVEGSGKKASVSVRLKVSKHLKVVGKAQQMLTIDELREQTARFKVKATRNLGSATLSFAAKLGSKRGKRSLDLSVRPAAPYLTTLVAGYLPPGKVRSVPIKRRLYTEFRKQNTGVGAIPLTLAHGMKAYLEAFPHGCTEQVVSRTMPAIVLGKHPGFGFDAQRAHHTISGFIDLVWTRQNSEGGFGQWVANPKADVLASVYAMHALTEAAERGYWVPRPLRKRGLAYLQTIAKRTPDDLYGRRLRGWAIYVLTRNQMVTTRYLKAAEKNLKANHPKSWRGDLASAFLAATHNLLQSKQAAGLMVDGQVLGAKRTANYAIYYDRLIHDGQLLYLLAKHFPSRAKEITDKHLGAMVNQIARGSYNTFSSAWAILGLEAYAKRAGGRGSAAGRTIEQIIKGQPTALTLPQGLMPLAPFGGKASALRFSNQSRFGAYYLIAQQGFDRTLAQKELAQKIEVFREYLDANGKPTSTVKVGDELQVRLRIRAKKAYQGNLAIVDLLPGGFEVVVQSQPRSSDDDDESDDESDGDEDEDDDGEEDHEGDESDNEGSGNSFTLPIALSESTFSPSYGDVREDRVVLYGGIGTSSETFVYAIKATNAGKYVAPPIQASSMYDRQVVARGTASSITVTPR